MGNYKPYIDVTSHVFNVLGVKISVNLTSLITFLAKIKHILTSVKKVFSTNKKWKIPVKKPEKRLQICSDICVQCSLTLRIVLTGYQATGTGTGTGT